MHAQNTRTWATRLCPAAECAHRARPSPAPSAAPTHPCHGAAAPARTGACTQGGCGCQSHKAGVRHARKAGVWQAQKAGVCANHKAGVWRAHKAGVWRAHKAGAWRAWHALTGSPGGEHAEGASWTTVVPGRSSVPLRARTHTWRTHNTRAHTQHMHVSKHTHAFKYVCKCAHIHACTHTHHTCTYSTHQQCRGRRLLQVRGNGPVRHDAPLLLCCAPLLQRLCPLRVLCTQPRFLGLLARLQPRPQACVVSVHLLQQALQHT